MELQLTAACAGGGCRGLRGTTGLGGVDQGDCGNVYGAGRVPGMLVEGGGSGGAGGRRGG